MDKLRRLVEAEENIVVDFQYALIDALNEKGLTKDDLAKMLGVSKARVSQWLSDDANPTLKTVAKIFDALDCCVPIVPASVHGEGAKAAEVPSSIRSFGASVYNAEMVWVRGSPWATNDNPYERESIAA